jgi:hypothetical protein
MLVGNCETKSNTAGYVRYIIYLIYYRSFPFMLGVERMQRVLHDIVKNNSRDMFVKNNKNMYISSVLLSFGSSKSSNPTIYVVF